MSVVRIEFASLLLHRGKALMTLPIVHCRHPCAAELLGPGARFGVVPASRTEDDELAKCGVVLADFVNVVRHSGYGVFLP
jgi:hypothetical protein